MSRDSEPKRARRRNPQTSSARVYTNYIECRVSAIRYDVWAAVHVIYGGSLVSVEATNDATPYTNT